MKLRTDLGVPRSRPRQFMETSKTEQRKVGEYSKWAHDCRLAADAIKEERNRQLMKWGTQTHEDGTWLKILAEEQGEVAKEMLAIEFARNEEELELAKKRLLTEAVQLAAVAAAYVQQLQSGNA